MSEPTWRFWSPLSIWKVLLVFFLANLAATVIVVALREGLGIPIPIAAAGGGGSVAAVLLVSAMVKKQQQAPESSSDEWDEETQT